MTYSSTRQPSPEPCSSNCQVGCGTSTSSWLVRGGHAMAELVDRLRTAADGLTRAIDEADTRGAWDAASPCEGWTAGDVADHIIGNYVGISEAAGTDATR